MIGAIRKRDILLHPLVTIDCFGWRLFVRALMADRQQTFLSLLVEAEALRPARATVPELLDRCIELEKQAARLYERLTARFADHPEVSSFFESLSRQERTHAELLGVCRQAARQAEWLEEHFEPCRACIPRLEAQMSTFDARAAEAGAVAEALQLVLEVEGSEINRVFRRIVLATGSDFVKRIRAFQRAGAAHIGYICHEIPKIDPAFAGECQRLRTRFFAA